MTKRIVDTKTLIEAKKGLEVLIDFERKLKLKLELTLQDYDNPKINSTKERVFRLNNDINIYKQTVKKLDQYINQN